MFDEVSGEGRLATVFGGSGFVGRHIVHALAREGWRVRVAVRRPDLAGFLQPIGGVGQVQSVQANLRYPDSVTRAIVGADVVVNATGIAAESGRQNFEAVHIFGSKAIASAAAQAGVSALVHISGLGADSHSASRYIASKGRAEEEMWTAFPATTILRPSVVFGPEDDFLNRFAGLARFLPILPLCGGGGTKLQPVYVGDVALAARAALNDAAAGKTFELGGPAVVTLREAVQMVLKIAQRRRALLPLPFGVSRILAQTTEIASALTLGLFPHALTTTRDQIDLLMTDNVVGAQAKAEGRDLPGLGIAPKAIGDVAASYLYRFRKTGQFAGAVTG